MQRKCLDCSTHFRGDARYCGACSMKRVQNGESFCTGCFVAVPLASRVRCAACERRLGCLRWLVWIIWAIAKRIY